MPQIVKGQDAARAIARHLETALASALTSMTGKEFTVTADYKSDAEKELAEPIVWQQTFSFSGEPALWLVAGKDLWSAAGRLTLGAVGVDSVSDNDCRSTWHEIAGQEHGSLCRCDDRREGGRSYRGERRGSRCATGKRDMGRVLGDFPGRGRLDVEGGVVHRVDRGVVYACTSGAHNRRQRE